MSERQWLFDSCLQNRLRATVREEQFTGQKEACVLIDGVVKYYPTATVELDAPFYQGKAKALCMENPLYDVIIGNIEGARMPTAADFEDIPSIETLTVVKSSKTNSVNKKTVKVGKTLRTINSDYDRRNSTEIESNSVITPVE